MNTQTHLLMGAALFGRRIPARAWAGLIGGVVPDLPMFAIYGTLKLYGINNFIIFGLLYWQNWWQVANAIAHNFWLWGGAVLFSILMRERRTIATPTLDRWTLVLIFAASGLLHSAIDFLCHREDAHMSFWPVTNWKFISPVSYWDPTHFGSYFQIFESLLGLLCVALLITRFSNQIVRLALAVAALIYVAVPIYWRLAFG
jgi:hypothetical protein